MPSYLDLAHGRRLATTGCSLSLKTHLFGKQGLHSGAFRFRVSGPPAAGAGPSQRAADSARRQLLDWHWQPGQWQRAPALPHVPSRLWPVVSCHSAAYQWIGPSESGQALAANQLLSVTVALPLPSHCHASGTML